MCVWEVLWEVLVVVVAGDGEDWPAGGRLVAGWLPAGEDWPLAEQLATISKASSLRSLHLADHRS